MTCLQTAGLSNYDARSVCPKPSRWVSVARLVIVGGFLYVGQFLLPLASLAFLRHKDRTTPAFQTPLPSVVLPLACGACLILLASSGVPGILGGAGWLLVGLLGYYGRRFFRSKGRRARTRIGEKE